MEEGVKRFSPDSYNAQKWAEFSSHLDYSPGSATEAESYARLKALLLTKENGPANRMYYLSVAPRFFLPIVEQLHAHEMVQEIRIEDGETAEWRRVVVEKPFGHDLVSAKALNQALHALLSEHQIYRIDHYLAKETVQNLMVFRFANTIFEPIWNRNYVDHVQITATETVDVGRRAGYYDTSGVLRDMFQNHLLQLLALVAMEPPPSFEADAVRNEKVKVLRALRPIAPQDLKADTVRAQYEGYAGTEGVAAGSQTPTFAALQLYIDNWRWQGVPFYLRSGKALSNKTTEIIIQFKRPPHLMFPLKEGDELNANYLAICIQPHEGMHLRFEVKVPDTAAEMSSFDMEFHYDSAFEEIQIPEAYERLLLEVLTGDATLFTRSDGIEAAWRYIDGVLRGFETEDAPPVQTYPVGSWGPTASDDMLARDGRKWRYGCADH